MSIPDELSLLSLFECEPKLLDNSVPYFYNEATYEFCNRNGEKFVVTLCPSYPDIKILVYSIGLNELISALDFKSVNSIKILSDKKNESKILIETEGGSIRVNFKPMFKVFLDYANYP